MECGWTPSVVPMATTFGIDISHHQGAFDLSRAAREGVAFVILKATEGSGFTDSRFAANLTNARQSGLLVAAYHYQRASASAAAQVAHIERVVPKNVPVIPDVEADSGGVALVRDVVARLRGVGYRVPMLYLPRWYWQQIGSPSLGGLPPLWSSRYPDNLPGTIPDEWADVPAHYWEGYGGLPVAVLQFTSSASVAGRQPIDANAYRGTRAQLAALLNGSSDEEDDMVRFLKGDSQVPIPGTDNVFGDVVFKVEYAHDRAEIAVRTRVPNANEPGFRAFIASGGAVHEVPQAVLDAIPDK